MPLTPEIGLQGFQFFLLVSTFGGRNRDGQIEERLLGDQVEELLSERVPEIGDHVFQQVHRMAFAKA